LKYDPIPSKQTELRPAGMSVIEAFNINPTKIPSGVFRPHIKAE